MYHYSTPHSSDSQHTESLPQNIKTVLESVRQLEASYGLHPFTFISMDDAVLRKKIISGLPNQEGSTDHAHLIILAIRPTITRDLINDYIADITNRKKVSRDSLSSYRKHFETTINKTDKEGRNWSEKQAHIALDALHEASRLLQVQVSVLEQINNKQIDQLLDLPAKGLRSLYAIVLNQQQGRSPASVQQWKTKQKDWSRN